MPRVVRLTFRSKPQRATRGDDGPRSARARQGRYLPARLAAFFADATVGPVLNAHTKEVRRKSTIDRELEVAELLAARGRPFLTAVELRANEMALRRAVLTL